MHREPEELARLGAGALAGTAVAAFIASLVRPIFPVPTGGVGWVTVHHYPKNWDVAVAGLIVLGAFAGALVAGHWAPQPPRDEGPRPRWIAVAVVVFVIACFIHDVPYAPLDFYHEGEHLSSAFLLRSGARPYHDVFFSHGFAADGGLDALVLGDPPTPLHVRRLRTVLGAATLALLAPIAAEVCATSLGVGAATFASLCAVGAGLLTLFTYFRLAPILIATLGLLRYLRTRRTLPLAVAMIASAAGVLWSLDAGSFALIGTAVLAVAIHAAGLGGVSRGRLIAMGLAAVLVPLAILVAVRADLRGFFVDSFVTMPGVAWVVWSLPQPDPPHLRDFLFWLADDPARYYVPLVVYGLVLAIAVRRWRSGDRVAAARIAIVATFALLLFRSAGGRVDPNHERFALPLFGIAVVAFILEPLVLRSRVAGTIVATFLFLLVLNVIPNVTGFVDAVRAWPSRHRHDGLVPVPLRAANGMYATPDVAADLQSLNAYVVSLGPDAEILDVANNRALYYLLERKSPAHYLDTMMWSAPAVFEDEMARLRARPPACVIVHGYAESAFDGLPIEERVPALVRWIDANYPQRIRFGRFVVAAR